MHTLIYLSLILSSLGYADSGAWTQKIPKAPPAERITSRLLWKVANFSTRGKVSWLTDVLSGVPCGGGGKEEAWITHRLSSRERPTAEAGRTLGQDLKQGLPTNCFSAIEIDMEPLPSPPNWAKGFLTGVIEAIGKATPVRLAIPPVSDKPLEGKALSWNPDAAAKFLAENPELGGVDIMLYDTALKSRNEFHSLLRRNLRFAITILTLAPEKTIVLGLPSYRDRTSLHDPSIETLHEALVALKNLEPLEQAAVCHPNLHLYVFSADSWDAADVRDLGTWVAETCQRTSNKKHAN